MASWLSPFLSHLACSVRKLNAMLMAGSFLFFQRSYVFTFLLSSRLFLHPYELMSRVCHLCVEQQRSGDPLLDKVGSTL